MRGKGTGNTLRSWFNRITPAHAGKRCLSVPLQGQSQDHPRACGEKPPVGVPERRITGSPPRMRGKVDFCILGRIVNGITPAHAGKSEGAGSVHGAFQDHPRACGEKISVPTPTEELPGITPAHAGKRQAVLVWASIKRDHPRACGEKRLKFFTAERKDGSPPRMRGKAGVVVLQDRFPGITPAHAGKSATRTKIKPCCGDHPRACGEKTKKIPYHRLFPLRSAPFSFSFA